MTVTAGIRDGVAPDYAEVIEAWRVWSVVGSGDGYRLGSVFASVVWPAGEPLAAECLKRPGLLPRLRRSQPSHTAPAERCECGIYATTLAGLAEYLLALSGRPSAGRVLGRVALWGEVVECERGFRASRAYPRSIVVPSRGTRDAWYVAHSLADYGAPVEMFDGRASDATRELERRLAA